MDLTAASEVTAKTTTLSFENFIEHIVPKSIFEAMATNEILQIVIFSIFFGLAAASTITYQTVATNNVVSWGSAFMQTLGSKISIAMISALMASLVEFPFRSVNSHQTSPRV